MTDTSAAGTDKSRELKLRVASAVVIGPLALVLTWFGGVPFTVMVIVGAVVMASEWATIVLGRSFAPTRLAVLALCGAAVAAGTFGARWGVEIVGALALVLLTAAATVLSRREAAGRSIDGALAWISWGAPYAVAATAALGVLRAGPDGLAVVVFLFFVVWATDIAAYFVGRRLGGPKLWPAVSPKKTWSGALGGLLGAAIAGTGVALVAGAPHLGPIVVLAAVLSIASQAGDLFESSLKRRFGVKDSGWIIPGHGGLLDRVDGLVAAAIAAVVVVAVKAVVLGASGGLLVW